MKRAKISSYGAWTARDGVSKGISVAGNNGSRHVLVGEGPAAIRVPLARGGGRTPEVNVSETRGSILVRANAVRIRRGEIELENGVPQSHLVLTRFGDDYWNNDGREHGFSLGIHILCGTAREMMLTDFVTAPDGAEVLFDLRAPSEVILAVSSTTLVWARFFDSGSRFFLNTAPTDPTFLRRRRDNVSEEVLLP